jgi:hypothetical protein
MSKEDKTLMDRYGITCTPKIMYFYKQYWYENLADAVRYAESDHAATPDRAGRTFGQELVIAHVVEIRRSRRMASGMRVICDRRMAEWTG